MINIHRWIYTDFREKNTAISWLRNLSEKGTFCPWKNDDATILCSPFNFVTFLLLWVAWRRDDIYFCSDFVWFFVWLLTTTIYTTQDPNFVIWLRFRSFKIFPFLFSVFSDLYGAWMTLFHSKFQWFFLFFFTKYTQNFIFFVFLLQISSKKTCKITKKKT